jgi:D-beta-D-heptose 7-phosphate kinase/D-beta-D-heptose 1-phosphate adenosyltransferase
MTRVFVNGTFDILHLGHIALLEWAKCQGDTLTVAIDSDRRVQDLKGSDRPINSQQERSKMLLALRCVDAVYVFDTDEDLVNLVQQHDIMVKGSDYRDQAVVGADVCKQLIFFDRIDGYSTTQKIKDITNR